MKRLAPFGFAIAALILSAQRSPACVGTDCLQIFSTEEGGGELTVLWDFEHRPVQTFKSFCAAGQCVFGAGDPGFRTEPPPPNGYHSLAEGTNVSIEATSIDPAVIVSIGGPLEENQQVMLGTAPTLHTHPTWQLKVPEGVQGSFPFKFRLTTDSAAYAGSPLITAYRGGKPSRRPVWFMRLLTTSGVRRP